MKAEIDLAEEIVRELDDYYQYLSVWQEGAVVEWQADKPPVVLIEDVGRLLDQAGFGETGREFFLNRLRREAVAWEVKENISYYVISHFLSYRLFSREIIEKIKEKKGCPQISPYLLLPHIEKLGEEGWLLEIGVLDQQQGRIYWGGRRVIKGNVVTTSIEDLWQQVELAASQVVKEINQGNISQLKMKQVTGDKSSELRMQLPLREWHYKYRDLTLYNLSSEDFTEAERQFLKKNPHHFVFRSQIDEFPIKVIFDGELLLTLGKRLLLSPNVEHLLVVDQQGKVVAEYNIFEQIDRQLKGGEGADSLPPLEVVIDGQSIKLAEYNPSEVKHFTEKSGGATYNFYDLFEPGRQQGILERVDRSLMAYQLQELHQDLGKKGGEIVNKVFVYLIRGGSGGMFDKDRDSVAVFIDPVEYSQLIEKKRVDQFIISTVRHEFFHALDHRYRLSTDRRSDNHFRLFFYQSRRNMERLQFLSQLAEEYWMGRHYGGHPADNEMEFFASLANSLYLPIDQDKLKERSVEFLAWYNESLLQLGLRLQQVGDLANAPLNKRIVERIMMVDEVLTEKLAEKGEYEYLFYPLLTDDIFSEILTKVEKDSEFFQWLVSHLVKKLDEKEKKINNKKVIEKVKERLMLLEQKLK